ncbi:MAG: hypothetical protein US36_C0018G0017 [Candidatus Wolfebacteria bacterium GW2011_GWC1_37_10]|nr:MAG: hypothetical protein US36_C0018G0017 [Candidatus Wolfebacteria bacterium GW2011_GWC1_37_10]
MKMFKGVKIKKALRKLKNQPTDEAFLKLLREKLVSYVEKTPFVRNEREESLYFQRFSPLFNVFNAKMFKTMPIAIILGLIGIGASAATVAASQNSLPGDTLYPVKILSEDARLAVIFNDESETKARMNLAQRRVEEISELITEAKLNTSITGEQIGKLELSLNKALDNFNSHLDIVSVKANEFQDKGESEKAF